MTNKTKVVRILRKSSVLGSPAFSCLRNIPTINITRGCLHSCIYCYAKGFNSSPTEGVVYLYSNLVWLLEKELQRKRKPLEYISFSTASDPFQPSDIVLATTYEVMELLLRRKIGITVLTKGHIPDAFIGLFMRHMRRVRVRIGLVSLSESYREHFEPNSAKIAQRLSNIARLVDCGIQTYVRIDPVIPGITDTEDEIAHLFSKLKDHGIKKAAVSCLIMRPYLYKEFLKVPSSVRGPVLRQYAHSPYQQVITSAKTKLLPKEYRERVYNRFREIGAANGIDVKVCGCKNPDLPWEYCMPWAEAAHSSGLLSRL